jgi:hypothetical protein
MTKQKIRAQPIGISAAPNMTGQARGEGGKDGRLSRQIAAALFVPLRSIFAERLPEILLTHGERSGSKHNHE